MGKFSGGGSRAPAPYVPPPAVSPGDQAEADDKARRTRLSEKRRAGRRATILAGRSNDDDLGELNVSRPTARAAKVLFGGNNA